MSVVDQPYEDEEAVISSEPQASFIAAKGLLEARCKAASIGYEERNGVNFDHVRVSMKAGRNTRTLVFASKETISRILAVPFEKYVFLGNLEAICSYTDGTIEAALRPVGVMQNYSFDFLLRRLFGVDGIGNQHSDSAKIELVPQQDGQPGIEISVASDHFCALSKLPARNRLTLKLNGCLVTTHDAALALLQKLAGSVLFQTDLVFNVPFALERERRIPLPPKRQNTQPSFGLIDLQYPQAQYDQAPLSLYSYARSATGMPLLQFLAFYQVIEFYFPIYSQSEAQRRIKAILKDPTFRGDRDPDIARLLASIQVNRSGAFGDERAQLRATMLECTDPGILRQFLVEDEDRKIFFQTKSKLLPCHVLPIATTAADLRADVAERIYDIRCKIVHTKSDSRDGSIELLLPFSPEADQLSNDIALVQFIAQKVLIASSTSLNMHT